MIGVSLSTGTSVHAVAGALLRFLNCLPEPVIPFSLYRRCVDCSQSRILCEQVRMGVQAEEGREKEEPAGDGAGLQVEQHGSLEIPLICR